MAGSLAFFLRASALILFLLFGCVDPGHAIGGFEERKALSPSELRDTQRRAVSGDTDASYHLGIVLLLGHGVERDPQTAKLWLERAADQGYIDAAGALAYAYLYGWLEGEKATAFAWVRRLEGMIEKPEHVRFYWIIGNYYARGIVGERNYPEAARYYEMALPSGLPVAYLHLAELMIKGVQGAPDYDRILKYLFVAWDAEIPQAALAIAHLYASGIGVPKDIAVAKKYSSFAAKANYLPAMGLLGSITFDHAEAASDVIEAISWFERIANSKMSDLGSRRNEIRWAEQDERDIRPLVINAEQKLGYIYSQTRYMEVKDCAKSIYWLQRALTTEYEGRLSERGLAAANMGVNYRDGCGVSRDLSVSRQWFERAVALGDRQAGRLIQHLNEMNESRGR